MIPDVVTRDHMTQWLRGFAVSVHEHAGYLTDLDAAIGDADHGANMDRGMKAVAAALDAGNFPTIEALAKKVGMTLVSSVGGASGPLYGTFFLRFGSASPGATELSATEFGASLRAGVDGIQQRGKAEPGDKTMLDAWWPALAAYDAALSGGDLPSAVTAAAQAAAEGRDNTRDWVARKGRASYLGERARGHIDPGATSTTYLIEALLPVLGGAARDETS